MDGDAGIRELEVVVWSPEGAAVLDAPSPAAVEVDVSDEQALPKLVARIEAGLGEPVAVRRITRTHVHVELLAAGGSHRRWVDADDTVAGALPWRQPGWYSATTGLIEAALAGVGLDMVGRPVQRKHWSISALLSVPTEQGEVWFKQVPAFMAHEGRLTAWLGRLRPGVVPEVMAAGDDWMLMRALPAPAPCDRLDSPFDVLAEVQVAAADSVEELLALGCPDRRLPQLWRNLQDLAARADLVDEPVRERLHGALPQLEGRFAELEDAGTPPSIVHGDLHAGNWSRSADGGWVLFDWTDGCVAHPFMELGVISRRDPDLRHARVARYAEAWARATGMTRAEVERRLALSEPVAAGFHAVSYQRIVDNLEGADAEGWRPVITSYVEELVELL